MQTAAQQTFLRSSGNWANSLNYWNDNLKGTKILTWQICGFKFDYTAHDFDCNIHTSYDTAFCNCTNVGMWRFTRSHFNQITLFFSSAPTPFSSFFFFFLLVSLIIFYYFVQLNSRQIFCKLFLYNNKKQVVAEIALNGI